MKPLVEIVTHCYCPPGQDVYAEHLKWQFASLHRFVPADFRVRWTVFYTPEDEVTKRRLDRCMELNGDNGFVDINPMGLRPEYLFRRAIGRDLATRVTEADVVWFTDVDYFFGGGAIESAWHAAKGRNTTLVMPKHVCISFDGSAEDGEDRPHHHRGEHMVDQERGNDWPEFERYCTTNYFTKRRQRVCIGGCQILSGEWARKHGYLRNIVRWQTPVDASMGFRSCRCDKAFRTLNNLSAESRDIPNVFRIRHILDGRDYNQQGIHVGKPAW